MNEINQKEYPDVHFGKNVIIRGESVTIASGAYVGDNVFIEAKKIEIGYHTKIDYGTTIKGLGVLMDTFSIGDNCLLGHNCQILTPFFSMKDYSQIHNNSLCSGYKPLTIGYNCWIGQGAILNSFENLTIGSGVRMGGCQIWTHVASGELMEGSNFHGSDEVVIEDNVWLMGFGQLVTPGVTLRKGSVIMAGSVVTKSTEPNKTYSGIPAKDVTEKLPAWKVMELENKVELAKHFVEEFLSQYIQYKGNIHLVSSVSDNFQSEMNILLGKSEHQIIIGDKIDLDAFDKYEHSIFDLSSKRYLKRRSSIEIDFIKFNLGYRARFIPFNL